MFPRRYFPGRYFAPRYFPQLQAIIETGTPAPTWIATPRPGTMGARQRPEVMRSGPRPAVMRGAKKHG